MFVIVIVEILKTVDGVCARILRCIVIHGRALTGRSRSVWKHGCRSVWKHGYRSVWEYGCCSVRAVIDLVARSLSCLRGWYLRAEVCMFCGG